MHRTQIVVHSIETGAFPWITQIEDAVYIMRIEVVSRSELDLFREALKK